MTGCQRVYVSEDDLGEWGGRDDGWIVSSLPMDREGDAERARDAPRARERVRVAVGPRLLVLSGTASAVAATARAARGLAPQSPR